MSVIQARVSAEEEAMISKYAKVKNISVSALIRESVIERIEDEIDLELYEKAMEEYRKNPVTYTQKEIERDLGLA